MSNRLDQFGFKMLFILESTIISYNCKYSMMFPANLKTKHLTPGPNQV